jgi:hypothetical protein
MKPVAERIDRRSEGEFSPGQSRFKFPLIDCDYQAFSLRRHYGGRGGHSTESFLNISRDYFQHEARRNFLAELAFFLIMGAILAGAIVEEARVIIHFLYLPVR